MGNANYEVGKWSFEDKERVIGGAIQIILDDPRMTISAAIIQAQTVLSGDKMYADSTITKDFVDIYGDEIVAGVYKLNPSFQKAGRLRLWEKISKKLGVGPWADLKPQVPAAAAPSLPAPEGSQVMTLVVTKEAADMLLKVLTLGMKALGVEAPAVEVKAQAAPEPAKATEVKSAPAPTPAPNGPKKVLIFGGGKINEDKLPEVAALFPSCILQLDNRPSISGAQKDPSVDLVLMAGSCKGVARVVNKIYVGNLPVIRFTPHKTGLTQALKHQGFHK